MKQQYSKLLIVVFLILSAPQAFAQLKGVITDSISHEPLMYISVFYEGKGVGGISNANGEYQVETRKGWNELTFSAVGYITKKVKIPAGAKELNVVLSPDDVMLDEVVIKPKKEKYSRKNKSRCGVHAKGHRPQESSEAGNQRLLSVQQVSEDEDVTQ